MRFLDDEAGITTSLELDCLKPRVGHHTILESYPTNSQGNVTIFNIRDIIAPADVVFLKGNKWDIQIMHCWKNGSNRLLIQTE